jgi:RNA polymerase sigma-70 factor (ECF subfamily)
MRTDQEQEPAPVRTFRGSRHAEWVSGALAQYEGPLIRYAARLTGDVERARDVVQDTFLKLCVADPAKVNAHLAQWLFTVCRNRALDVCRKENRMTLVGDCEAAAVETTLPGPVAQAERTETRGRLAELVDTLPEKQQEVVRLKFQNGLTYREIGEVTGLTVSNVGYLIHTAIRTLREQVRAQTGPARA